LDGYLGEDIYFGGNIRIFRSDRIPCLQLSNAEKKIDQNGGRVMKQM
jgi:hypothetical protein